MTVSSSKTTFFSGALVNFLVISIGAIGIGWANTASVIAQTADRSAIVPNLQMNILTGGDNLRDGSVAYAEIRLRNGTVLPKVNMNGGRGFGDNSNNLFSLNLPTGTTLGDLDAATVTLSHDGAARRWPDGYDNWNVDAVNITTPRVCSGNVAVAGIPANPWVRFTGGKTFKNLTFSVPPSARSSTASTLNLKIVTGRDDLRDGSVAYMEIRLRNGRMLPKINLNNGVGWGGNSTRTVSLSLPTGTRLGDLGSFTISHDGAARRFPDGYDNWDVNTIVMTTPEVCSSISLANPSGRPWVRFTGGKTFEPITLQVQ